MRQRFERFADRLAALEALEAEATATPAYFDEHDADALDDAAPVRGDPGLDELREMGLELTQRSLLIARHEAAIADHVSGKNRCKLAFGWLFVHAAPGGLRHKIVQQCSLYEGANSQEWEGGANSRAQK